MKLIKKILGIVWIVFGAYAAYYIGDVLAIPKFSSDKGEDLIAGIIYLFLVPIISLSLVIFGWYAIKGEYTKVEE